MKARYESRCGCGWSTIVYRDPDYAGVSFCLGTGDGAERCRCGNGGFIFRLVSRRQRERLVRQEALNEYFGHRKGEGK